MWSSLFSFLGVALYVSLSSAAPSPTSLKSDLTVLVDNDLYGSGSTRKTAAILLNDVTNITIATSACQSLGEQLWTPELQNFNLGLNNSLAYQVYQGHYNKDQLFWIGQQKYPESCRAINTQGHIEGVGCHNKYPVLCTQSAPLSSISSQNTSTRFQVSQQVGNLTLTGYRDFLTFRFFGIRYAPQPQRFTYSTLYRGSGAASAVAPGSECVQTTNVGTEDCLFLNVWTPYLPASGATIPKKSLKAVMFWIHGGAFTGGTGSDSTFDGGNMAARGDVVVVTINYRISTLGFLALNDGVTNGNFGLADIITALEWTNENIRAFGGDPSRITIFGQSAGGSAVRALLASPPAKGLFAAALPQSNLGGSNYGTTYSQYYTIPQEVSVAAEPILEATGCNGTSAAEELACLRAYDPYKLVGLSTVARYLVVDGTYLVTNELPLNGSSYIANVPLLMGIMRDDGAPFIGYPTTTNVTQALNTDFFPGSTITGSNDFPTPAGPNVTLDVFNVTARVATDSEFRCIDQATAYSAALHGVVPSIYYYEFNRSYQTPGFDPNAPVCDASKTAERALGDTDLEYFKCHSGELYYEFGNLLRQNLPTRDELDIPFSQVVLDHWTSFGRTYNPNPNPAYLQARGYYNTAREVAAAGQWAKVDVAAPMLRQLQWTSNQIPFRDGAQCAVLGFPLDYYESH